MNKIVDVKIDWIIHRPQPNIYFSLILVSYLYCKNKNNNNNNEGEDWYKLKRCIKQK
jgi:hypothetical protein